MRESNSENVWGLSDPFGIDSRVSSDRDNVEPVATYLDTLFAVRRISRRRPGIAIPAQPSAIRFVRAPAATTAKHGAA
jgi:hypothetical protein